MAGEPDYGQFPGHRVKWRGINSHCERQRMYNVSGAVFKPSVPGKKVVYLHRKKTDGEIFYVGYGIKSRPFTKGKRNRHWWAVVNKHGYEVEVIYENLSTEMAKNIERVFIALCGGMENLTNKTRGGEGTDGYRHTDESREAMSEKRKGKLPYERAVARLLEVNLGSTKSVETKQKISDNRKGKCVGEDHGMYGKKHSDETINGLTGSYSANFRGFSVGVERTTSKIIVFDGEKSMTQRNFKSGAISQVILGRKASYKNFIFRRSKDENYLRQLLAEDNFFDEQSKTIIQNFVQ